MVTGPPVVSGYPVATQRSPSLRLGPHEVVLPVTDSRLCILGPSLCKLNNNDISIHTIGEIEMLLSTRLWKGGLIRASWYFIYDQTCLGYFPQKIGNLTLITGIFGYVHKKIYFAQLSHCEENAYFNFDIELKIVYT